MEMLEINKYLKRLYISPRYRKEYLNDGHYSNWCVQTYKKVIKIFSCNNWSKPYYGVSHYLNAKFPYQATINVFSKFVEAKWFNLNSSTPFTPTEKIFFGPNIVRTAKKWLESKV